MADAVNISKRTEQLDKAPLFEPYSKVIIHVGIDENGEPISYSAGNDTGRTMEFSNEWGTQEMANRVLNRIRGYQYQPYTAEKALIDPSVELGDGLTVSGLYSGIFVQATTFNALMPSDASAPVDEEITHEYGFESQTNRAYTRMVAQTRSGITQNAREITAQVEEIRKDTTDLTNEQSLASKITVNAGAITQEVTDRKKAVSDEADARDQAIGAEAEARDKAIGDAVEEMSSSLTQTANQIRGEVVAKKGGESKSFAWDLQSTYFSLIANNKEVFRATKDGISVTGSGSFSGEIKASSGNIGNLTLKDGALYTNGKTGIDTAVNGLHISANGISLGNGNFKVTNQGAITAKSGTVGGFTITASSIYNGMTSAADNQHDGLYISTTSGISLGKGGKFRVTTDGAVTASNLTITGGSISINNGAFSVDKDGKLSANTGTFKGDVYAKKIKYSSTTNGEFGMLNGVAITPQTISGSDAWGNPGQIKQYSLKGTDIASNTISGGDGGNIQSNTLTDLNVVPNTYTNGGLSTQSLTTGIGASLGLADFFGEAIDSAKRRYPNNFTAKEIDAITAFYSGSYKVREQGEIAYDLTAHYHDLKVNSDGKIEIGTPQKKKPTPFNIADTQAFKDGVEAVTVKSLDISYTYDDELHVYKIKGVAKNKAGDELYSSTEWNTDRTAYIEGQKAATVSKIELNREYQGDKGWYYYADYSTSRWLLDVKLKALNDATGKSCGTDTVTLDITSMVNEAQTYGRNQNAPTNVYKEIDEYGDWDGKTVWVRTGYTSYTGFKLQ